MTNIDPFTSPDPFYYDGGVYPAGFYIPNRGHKFYQVVLLELNALKSLAEKGDMNEFMDSFPKGGGQRAMVMQQAEKTVYNHGRMLMNSYTLMDIAILNSMVVPIDTDDGCPFLPGKSRLFFDNRLIADKPNYPNNGQLILKNVMEIMCSKYDLKEIQRGALPADDLSGNSSFRGETLSSWVKYEIACTPGKYEISDYGNGSLRITQLIMTQDARYHLKSDVMRMSNGKTEAFFVLGDYDSRVSYHAPGRYELPRQIFRLGHLFGQNNDRDESSIFSDRIGKDPRSGDRGHTYEFCFDHVSCSDNFRTTYHLVELVENVFAYKPSGNKSLGCAELLEG